MGQKQRSDRRGEQKRQVRHSILVHSSSPPVACLCRIAALRQCVLSLLVVQFGLRCVVLCAGTRGVLADLHAWLSCSLALGWRKRTAIGCADANANACACAYAHACAYADADAAAA